MHELHALGAVFRDDLDATAVLNVDPDLAQRVLLVRGRVRLLDR
ncbi:hypothetical protein [Nonomuraea sp. NPDC049480]